MSYGICLLHIVGFEYKIEGKKDYVIFDKKRRERLQREANKICKNKQTKRPNKSHIAKSTNAQRLACFLS